MPAKLKRRILSSVRREHAQWLVAAGALVALVNRSTGLWLSCFALLIISLAALLKLRHRFGIAQLRLFHDLEAFCFGCIAMAGSRLLADFVLDLLHMPNRPRSALWVGGIVLIAGWGTALFRRVSLFAFGIIEITWGVVLGINSQSFIRGGGSGSIELLAMVTSIFLVARGFDDCHNGNLSFLRNSKSNPPITDSNR